jgi:hypothetical protein
MTDDRSGADAAPEANGADETLEGEIVDEGGDPGSRADPAGGDAHAGRGGVIFDAALVTNVAKEHRDRAALTLGSVLVMIGAVLLAGRFSDTVAAGGPALWVGLGFLVWWAFRGTYGLLLPAGVLTGLGLGSILDEIGFYGNAVALGLGAGFFAIYALDALRRRRRPGSWPLVPGVALVAVGLLQHTSGWDALGNVGWPLFLITIGLLIVGGALSRRETRHR